MKIYLLTLLTIVIILPIFTFPPSVFAAIKKSGDIEIITDEPLFPDSIIWYPGLTVSRGLQVKNRGNQTKTVQIEAINEISTLSLPTILSFDVLEGATNRYGDNPDKTMKNFFDDQTVSLFDVPVDDNGKAFSLVVSMPYSAGNEYQNGKATFDLRVGFPGDSESSVIITSTTAGASPTPTPPVVLGRRTFAGQELVLGEETTPSPVEGEITPTPIPKEGSVFGAQTTGIDLRWVLVGGILLLSGVLFFLWWRGNR